jgi:diguanylate cyclase (GGDEF)-like protein/PAS domain S-box-containing protein
MALNRKVSPIAVPLRTIITIPYILLIFLSISIVGYVSYQNGEASVNKAVLQLRDETALRIKQHLTTFLDIPHQINQLNAYAIQSGELNPADTAAMQQHFLEQVKLHPSITSVYFGNKEGALIGGGREGAKGSLYVTNTENNQSGEFFKFGVDEAGKTAREPLASIPNFDGRTRPWYVSAAQKGDETWSNIYVLFTEQDMAIAASHPVYDKQNNLLGVVSVDIFLSQLSNYLKALSISPIGQVFIMERSGTLVATSTGETLFGDINGDGVKERLFARDSQSAVIRQSDSLLVKTYGDYKDISGEGQQLEFTLNGERQFLQFLPVGDPYGVDWIVVVVTPESAFMKQIHDGNRVTFWLVICTLAGSIATSVFISSKITKRISELDKSAQALADGKWDAGLDTDTRIAELNELATSFNQMKEQLRGTLDNLKVEVAERKHMGEALRESESLLAEAQLVGHFGHAEWVSNRNEVICSDEMLRIFGLPSNNHIISRDAFDECVHTDDRQRLLDMDRKYIAERSDLDYEYRVLSSDNMIRWIHQHAKVTYNENGVPLRMIGVFQDITERKLSEQKLQESEKRFRNLVETTSDWIWETDANGVYTYTSPQVHDILGFDPSEIIGKTPFDLMPPEEAKQASNLIFPVFAARSQLSDFENKNLHKDGHVVVMETSGVPIFDHNGIFSGYRGIDRDITKRKQAEEKLHEGEARLAIIFKTSPVAIAISRISDNYFIEANDAFERLTGYSRAETIGHTAQELNLWVRPEERTSILHTLQTSVPIRDFEFQFRNKSNNILDMVMSAELIELGGEKCMLTIAQDITKRKQTEEALKRSQSQLTEALRSGKMGHWEYDVASDMFTFNDQFYSMLRTTAEQEGGYQMSSEQYARRFSHPNEMRTVATEIQRARIATDPNYSHQVDRQIIFGDGTSGYMAVHIRVIFDSQGRVIKHYGVNQDITERKQTEEKLRASEERFRAISETAGDLIFSILPDGSVGHVNELAARAFQSTPQALIGRHMRDLFPPTIFEQQWNDVKLVFESGKAVYEEAISHFPNGDEWLATWLAPLCDENGNIISVLGDSRNITERKQMEQELQTQRDFATQVINMMGQGLTVTDSNGRFEFVNPAYARLFGYEPIDLIGKEPKDVTALDDRMTLEMQRKHRMVGNTTTYESRLRRADGSIAHVLITGVPRGSEGQYEGSIAVITDLTEQKRIEEELRQAKDLLELANLKLEQSLLREQELSHTDDLTGVNNRRHLFELAELEFAVAVRYKRPLAVMLFDIDHFKKVNDTFGHAVGDEVLKHITQIARSELRKADVIGRYGGEEFIILLPMTNSQQAYLLAERIRTKVKKLRTTSENGEVSTSLSIGIVEMTPALHSETVGDMFHRADQAMYRAKEAGRNRTVILGES